MPIFYAQRLLFIHIPKCGGDTVTYHLRSHSSPPFLFVDDGSVMVNGHTPQHMTWREILQAGWKTPPEFRIVTLVRHPIERVLSEYRYIRMFRKDLLAYAESPSAFLDAFLEDSVAARRRFDNHNVSILEFLKNQDGYLDPNIEIYLVDEMNSLMGSLGLPPVPANTRRNVTSAMAEEAWSHKFSVADIDRIAKRYQEDIDWFENRFPAVR